MKNMICMRVEMKDASRVLFNYDNLKKPLDPRL